MERHARTGWNGGVAGGLALLVLGLTAPALAQSPGSPPGPGAQKGSLLTPEDRTAMGQIFWHRMQQRLGLSDQQVSDIRSLLEAQRTTMRTNLQNLMAARKQLRGLLQQPTVDATAVQAAASQVKAQQAALFDEHLQTQLALRTKLTAEQWQQWQGLRKGRWHRGVRRGHGVGPAM